jgi:ABC-2 type transport system permease protein
MKMNHENDNDLKNNNPDAQETKETEEIKQTNEPATQTDAAEQPVQSEKQDEAEEPKKEDKPKQHKIKEYTASARFQHGSISTAFTVGFIAVIILINVIVGILGDKYPSMNLDLTKGSTNTLSTQALDIVKSVKEPVTLYIMATETQTKNDQILTNYGIQYSQVGILAAKIAENNSNIKVEYIDLTKNPTFATKYKSDNLEEGDVLVVGEKRNRVLAYTDLFDVQYSQDGQSTNTYSKVDSGLASGLNSVMAENLPVVAFDTGHSEKIDATTYKSLLTSNNFETKDFNLLTDAVPDKTQMIVLGCPSSDYTDEEITKLDAFLSSTKLAGDRTLMVTFHPSQATMPKLATFLKEWGIEVPQAVIVESDQTKYYTNDPSYILSTLQTTLSISSKSDYGYFTTPQSNPINLLFDTQGTKKTYSLAKSNATCYLQTSSTKSGETPEKGTYNTAVLSQDTITSGDKSYKANVITMGSTMMFSSDIMAASTFGNASYMVDLSKYATGTSNAATAVTSISVQTNVSDITLSTGASTVLGLGVFTLLIPLLIAIAGICVYHKRRHL